MISEIISDILGNVVISESDPSKKIQALIRILIGLMGVVLTFAGLVKMYSYDAGPAFRLAGAFLFVMLICFCGFNIASFRKWKWPGRLLLLSLPVLFAVRIIFGP